MRLHRRKTWSNVPRTVQAPLVDDLDREHLLGLAVEKITASTPYGVGYAAGRFVEYVAQNAIPQEAVREIVREAYVRVFNDDSRAHEEGPALGLTC